jgi:hypothetical protein
MPHSESVDAAVLVRLERGAGLLYRCLGFKMVPLNAYFVLKMYVKEIVLEAKLQM